jgi:hypothetical protein
MILGVVQIRDYLQNLTWISFTVEWGINVGYITQVIAALSSQNDQN